MKKVLLFGFEALPEILKIAAALRPFGAEAGTCSAGDWNQTLAKLAEGKAPGGGSPLPPPGKMLVLCGLEGELDSLLPALRQAGAACPKAALTAANRSWTPARLYRQLERERRAMGGY